MEYNTTLKEIYEKIKSGEIDLEHTIFQDENEIEWFYNDGELCTGMKNGDREPPFIFLTDKYNVNQLFNLKFVLIGITKINTDEEGKPDYNYHTLEWIVSEYKNSKSIVRLIDTYQNIWIYNSVTGCVTNEDGESITEYKSSYAAAFEENYTILDVERAVEEEEARDVLIRAMMDSIEEINSQAERVKLLYNQYKCIEG